MSDRLFNCPTIYPVRHPTLVTSGNLTIQSQIVWLETPAFLLFESSQLVPPALCPVCLFMLLSPDYLKLLYPETLLSEMRLCYWMCFVYLEN